MVQKGLFITFEGADGSGKTTQLEKIADLLTAEKFNIVKTREPGALDLGKKIRNILLHHVGIVSPNCEMFLFLADRAQHVDTFIKPALEEGKIVLCDRYIDSTVAYQGYGRGNNIERIEELNRLATSNLLPDLTLVFDINAQTAQNRLGKEKDRLESAGMDFHQKVRNGYLNLAQKFPDRIKVVDANNSIDNVYNDTKNIIISFIQDNAINRGN